MQTESFIPGKDASLESTIRTMQQKLAARGFHLNESSWLNPVEAIWSVHMRDNECPMLFSNGKDIYVADFTEQGAYSCRILVPGMSEIYPVEDLEWENNSVGNDIRPALVKLPLLSDVESGALLADLQTSNLNDERPLWEILGLAIPVGTVWKELRIGELKTLLALAIGDEEATREGCDWIHQYKQMNPTRRLVYRCIESLMNLDDVDLYRRSLILLYGAETVRQAEALLNRQERFFGLHALGADMEGSQMHQTLLAAYDKLFAGSALTQ